MEANALVDAHGFDPAESPPDMGRFIEIVRNSVFSDITDEPRTAQLCTECGIKSARIACKTCNDFFCQACFSLMHAAEKRQKHEIECIFQVICHGCDHSLAARQVDFSETMNLCEACFMALEAVNNLGSLRVRYLRKSTCSKCHHEEAKTSCKVCRASFCFSCDHLVHLRGLTSEHSRAYLDDEASEQ